MSFLPSACYDGAVEARVSGTSVRGAKGARLLTETVKFWHPDCEDDAIAVAMVNAPVVGDLHPVWPWFSFTDADGSECSLTSGGCSASLTTVWAETGQDPSEPPVLPEDTCTGSADPVYRPIARHPKFAEPNPDWGGCSLQDFYDVTTQAIYSSEKVPFQGVDAGGLPICLEKGGEDVPEKIRGLTTFADCSSTKTCCEFSFTDPGEPEEFCGIKDPPGVTSAGNWLVIGGSVQQQGGYFKLTLNYIYSATPWCEFIYD